MLDNLLELSEAQAERLELQLEAMDIGGLARNIAMILESK